MNDTEFCVSNHMKHTTVTLFQWGFSQGVEEGGVTWDSITDASKMEAQWIYRRILIGATFGFVNQERWDHPLSTIFAGAHHG